MVAKSGITLAVSLAIFVPALAESETAGKEETKTSLEAAAAETQQSNDFSDLSLRDLLNVEVSSASRRLEPLAKTSAAIYVITQDDIRRMGATSIPEALRVVPGLHVAKIDANKWSISSRGFSGQFSNKLLVLLDGRSVYTPLYSGVYWDAHDVVMEDIDRIEVIRGPGASLWGANAVNGVINVITKKAQETEGLLVSAGGGSDDGYGAVRYGGRSGENLSYRLFARYSNRNSNVLPSGDAAFDAWDQFTGGFRVDWTKDNDALMFLGNAYGGTLETGLLSATPVPPFQAVNPSENQTQGMSVVSRWNHDFSASSNLVFQAYYDRFKRDDPSFYVETRDTVDLEMQHGIRAGRHDLLWGANYRLTSDELPASALVTWTPVSRNDQILSLFGQDRISLASDRLRITIGSKLSHNDYTGFEVQPNLRFAVLRGDHTFWGAVSRAVRTPARFEHTFEVNSAIIPQAQGIAFIFLEGNPAVISEEVTDYELGYRVQPTERFSFDFTGFYNDYDHLSSTEPAGPPTFVPFPFPHVELRQAMSNLAEGKGYGAELAVNLVLVDPWRVAFSYSYLTLELQNKPGGVSQGVHAPEGAFPQNQFRIQSYLDLSRAFELDAFLYYVDELPSQQTPSFTKLDFRFAWKATESLELALVGQNLLDDNHLEYGSINNPATSSLTERSALVQIRWSK